ncbi:MAG TPA: mechanosensitive ion channel domain-containing protein [Steroidobacteraceae bacterium]|nr:mechanosensitive ion channel domain-containing protein [Steroidobacteraceae bacterium]
MPSLTAAVDSLLQRFADPLFTLQLAWIGGSIAVALATGVLIRRVRRDSTDPATQADDRGYVARALVASAPYLLGLLVLLIGRVVLGAPWVEPHLIDGAVELLGVLVAVRLVINAVLQILGPRSWLNNWHNVVVTVLWLSIGLQQIGWLGVLARALDGIALLPGKAQFSLWALLKGLVVITCFVLVTSLIARTVERRVMTLRDVALSTRIGISKFSFVILLTIGVLLGINATGVDVTALTLPLGAIGIGLGFGLQAIASNFVSGFVLLMDKSIKPGDVISFAGQSGTSTENFGWVQELRGRYVVVRDRDGIETLVPNQNLITNPVINWSYSDRKIRLKLPVRVSYRDDPELALAVLIQASAGHPRVLREPMPVARLMQFSDHGMDLELRFWIADPEDGVNNVRSDVNRRIWRLFKDNGITIPVAQREIYLHERGQSGT